MTNNSPTVQELYQDMLQVSRGMLQAANEEAWDDLIELEKKRAGIVEVLQVSDNLIPDTDEERSVLIGLIREIQQCDDRVRPMITGWMAELKAMFESAGNERKLGKQYGAF